MSCPECNRLSCCGVLNAGYYSTLRESHVRVQEHFDEFEVLLRRAFALLNWTE